MPTSQHMNGSGCEERAAVETVSTTELLLLSDGRVLVHNLTAEFAALLSELNPDDADMARRARTLKTHGHRHGN